MSTHLLQFQVYFYKATKIIIQILAQFTSFYFLSENKISENFLLCIENPFQVLYNQAIPNNDAGGLL